MCLITLSLAPVVTMRITGDRRCSGSEILDRTSLSEPSLTLAKAKQRLPLLIRIVSLASAIKPGDRPVDEYHNIMVIV